MPTSISYSSGSPFKIAHNSIIVQGRVNEQPVEFILDTGDAVGPVFNAHDATRLKLPRLGIMGVSGAGGATENYGTEADIELNGLTWLKEPGAIDPYLQGPSLIGLPFFLRETAVLSFNFQHNTYTITKKA